MPTAANSTPGALAVREAASFWQRFCGLMLTKSLPGGQALLLRECSSVHTCFMRYAIDLAYLDAAGVVVGVVPHLAPWRMSFGPGGAAHTLELAAGSAARLGIQVGSDWSGVLGSRPTAVDRNASALL